ncbi:MAG: glycosyltransferase family 2 protein [Planctomycetaceae bacterium]|nr:glycosyltransferase family 2 protein [Planctomycetaceae bacterium]
MSAEGTPPLSLVVPAYNEERRLGPGLDRMLASLEGRPGEVIVVDDGSRDGTREIACRRAAQDSRIRVVGLDVNQGKGAAVAAGMRAARGDWILCTDTDLSTPLSELARLERYRDSAEVIIGSRALPDSDLQVRQPLRRENLGRAFNHAVRLAALYGIYDTQCGFKLWSRRAAHAVFPRMRIRRFAFDVEALWLARRLGFRIREVGVLWKHDPATTVRVFRDGMRMGGDLLRVLGWRVLGR